MIKYDFADISGLAEALRQNGRVLIQQTEALESAVASLRHTFVGSAADAYDNAMRKWQTELADTQAILNKIANQVENGGQSMNQTDRNAAANLGG